MIRYHVSIEIGQNQVPVGMITGNDSTDACFSYDKGYMEREGAVPVSISLPFREGSFSPYATKAFFDGLLPEGFTRRSVAQHFHVDENDYLGMLLRLGRECNGALRISDEAEEPGGAYKELKGKQIADLASQGAAKATELMIKSHLSLAGASGKVGLYYEKERDKWFLPIGTAPSTHIVKQSHIRLEGIVTNEQLSMLTARKLGIDVPQSFIINVGKGEDSEVLFATERYDRVIGADAEYIDGLARPYRLHQEDFAQALGIPSEYKYESEKDEYAKDIFELLRKHSADPIADQMKLLDRIIYNCLIGNTDAHIKNFSLLYGTDMKDIRLSPAYDMISTVIYESSTDELSFGIGGAKNIRDVTRASFSELSGTIGIGEKLVMKEYDRLCDGFENALKEAAYELNEQGFSESLRIADLIKKKGCVKALLR